MIQQTGSTATRAAVALTHPARGVWMAPQPASVVRPVYHSLDMGICPEVQQLVVQLP